MDEERLPLSDVKDLAEEAMSGKAEEPGQEGRTQELWDVPSEDAATLAAQQQPNRESGL